MASLLTYRSPSWHPDTLPFSRYPNLSIGLPNIEVSDTKNCRIPTK
jgi:hypothetical protein